MAGNKDSKLQVYLVCVLSLNICTSAAGARSAIHKKIQYHLLELNKALQELSESNTHVIHKRSVLNHDEIIYNSLMVFCNEMNSGGGLRSSNAKPNQTNFSSTKHTSEYSLKTLAIQNHTKIPDTSPLFTWPQIFPRKVQAERDGNDLWLVFDVIHTAPVKVTRYHSFETIDVVIDYPDKLTTSSSSLQPSTAARSQSPILSKVRLRIDASQCVNLSIPSSHQFATISFELVGKIGYLAETDIDLCMFDYFLNETVAYENQVWEKKKEKIFTDNLSPPYLNITPPDLGHEILIKKGQDIVFYLDTELRKYDSSLSIALRIWDRSNGRKIIKSERNLRYSGDTIEIPRTDDDLLSMEILEQHKMGSSQSFGNDSPIDNEKDNLRVKIKITIKVSNGKRSGKLLMSYFENRFNFNDRKLVETFSSHRISFLKLPIRPTILPKNQVEIILPRDNVYKCDKDGIMHYPKTGKNCTVQCQAYGTDIKDIFISDTNSRRPLTLIVNSVSRVIQNGTSAFAMIDLGPASKNIEGTYRCTATTSNGKRRRQDVQLFTSLFTEVKGSDIKEFANGTVKLTCEAFGAQPLNMSISVRKDNGELERVDNKSGNSRSISIYGNISILTLLLPTEQLRYPYTSLYCDADGERGGRSSVITLEDKISYHYHKK